MKLLAEAQLERVSNRPAFVAAALWLLAAPGCQSSDSANSTCMQVDTCASFDQAIVVGDRFFSFSPDIASTLSVGFELGDAGLQPSSPPVGFVPVDAEIVLTPASDGSGAITLKTLRFQFPDFQVAFGGGSVTVSVASIQFVTPIAIAPTPPAVGGGSDFFVPAGTVVHTCATIDGKAWHASAATTERFDIHWDMSPSTPGVVTVNGTFPFVVRKDDAQCTPSTFQGNISGGLNVSSALSPLGDGG